jgi:hypothetical protein
MKNLMRHTVSPSQYVAWMVLDSELCQIKKMTTRASRGVWQEIGKN